ncbi:class I SAM-dependent methyltransferase [soil metagenome]
MTRSGVFGYPPPDLVEADAGALQLSPLNPGGEALEAVEPGSLERLVMLAPPGTLERRYALALGLRALAPGGALTALAPKVKGGSRLRQELQSFGTEVAESAKAHHRICVVAVPPSLSEIDAAVTAGAPRIHAPLGLWTQPGVFSWDRIDPGSALLMANLPAMKGEGVDFGCGVGVLAHAVLASLAVTALTLIDIDRRAVDCAKRNVDDPRASLVWADARNETAAPAGLDFVVMNPPFHDGGAEDRALGQAFVRRAAASLRKGGVCWMVANRHLPYEAALNEAFTRYALRAESGGYKVFEAVR